MAVALAVAEGRQRLAIQRNTLKDDAFIREYEDATSFHAVAMQAEGDVNVFDRLMVEKDEI